MISLFCTSGRKEIQTIRLSVFGFRWRSDLLLKATREQSGVVLECRWLVVWRARSAHLNKKYVRRQCGRVEVNHPSDPDCIMNVMTSYTAWTPTTMPKPRTT